MKEQLITLRAPKVQFTPRNHDINQLHALYHTRLRGVLQRIKETAKQRTPVKTGRLRGGYVLHQKTTGYQLDAGIGNNVEYFDYIENWIQRPVGYRKIDIPTESTTPGGGGDKMLASSIHDHRAELRNIEQGYIQDFENLIGIRTIGEET